MPELNIRKATPSDAPALAAIAESVRFESDTADPSRGYLVFVGSIEEYAERLESGLGTYVAEHDGQVIAYLTTSSLGGSTATQTEGDEVMARIFGENAILIDQIGVSPDSRGMGAAPLMYRRMLEELQPSRLTACIMHGPLRNERSIGFFSTRNGFRCVGEYHDGQGFLWGIYEWKSNASQGDPRYPIGRFLYAGPDNELDFAERIARLRALPAQLRATCSRLPAEAIDTAPRPGAWTSRQIIHHIADTHQVLTGRVRLTLTETRPTVKTFEEDAWSQLPDARSAPIESSLALLDGVHSRLCLLLEAISLEDLSKEMIHPQQGPVKLDRLLSYLDWHGRHHSAQVSAMAR